MINVVIVAGDEWETKPPPMAGPEIKAVTVVDGLGSKLIQSSEETKLALVGTHEAEKKGRVSIGENSPATSSCKELPCRACAHHLLASANADW